MHRLPRGLVLLLLACTPEAEPNCGDSLTCTSSEFCLVILPVNGDYGDQTYSCQALPPGCVDFDAMCSSAPECTEDWVDLYCEPDPIAVGCSSFGSTQEAVCEQ